MFLSPLIMNRKTPDTVDFFFFNQLKHICLFIIIKANQQILIGIFQNLKKPLPMINFKYLRFYMVLRSWSSDFLRSCLPNGLITH